MLPCELYPRVNETIFIMDAADAARCVCTSVSMSLNFADAAGQVNRMALLWYLFPDIFCEMPSGANM